MRKMMVEMAHEIIAMNNDIEYLIEEVRELREYKKKRQDQDSQYVNNSANGINDILKAIAGK